MSAAKLSKLENNRVPATVADVERILAALEIPPRVRSEFLALARAASTEQRAWRVYRRLGFHKRQQEIAAIEGRSTEIRVFQSAMIPGLLQSAEYVRSLFSASSGLTEEERSRTAASRLKRQDILYEREKRFYFLLTESALRWTTLDKSAMSVQIDRIISLSKSPNITIELIRFDGVKEDFPISSFCVFDRRLVTVETFHAEISTRDPRDVDLHMEVFDDFSAYALKGGAARDALAEVSEGFR
ncbi:hypothetical protein HDA32_000262 [Spinactinospora alkalitolerans]|uniref:DUF5753 domain-containing protein n=2 Tax=Spinactinospora alkalitolerans TaxID=687207 RepID=A0A852TQP6_9ACTN|nr:hypothetical protein [Spinactinospora alkalitolerans]